MESFGFGTTGWILVGGSAVAILLFYAILVMINQNARWRMPGQRSDDPNVIWRELSKNATPPDAGSDIWAEIFKSGNVPQADTTSDGFPPKTPSLPQYFPSTTPARKPGAGCNAVIGGMVVGLILIGIGLGVAGYAFYIWNGYTSSEDWPTTRGTVTSATISESYDSEDSEYSYKPEISYQYEVDDVLYESDDLDFDIFPPSYGDRADAQAIVNRYRDGSSVTVIYDPDDPGRAVLERQYNETLTWGMMIGGLIGICVGITAILFNFIRGLRSLGNAATMQPTTA